MMRTSLIGLSIAAVAAAALVTACGGNDATPGTPPASSGTAGAAQPADHNSEDIIFAQQMIPHHSQALEMAKLAPSRSTNPKVLDLASRIEKAQDPEIQQMQSWLTKWGAGTTSTPGTGQSAPSSGGGHGGSAHGTMTEEEMQQLEHATGAEFDRMFLEMMITHHQGAIDMAKIELEQGASAEAKELAQKIIDAQQAEITEMEELLKSS